MIALSVQVDNKGALASLAAMSKPVRQKNLAAVGQLVTSRAKDNIANRTGPAGNWPRSGLTDLYAGRRTWADISRSITFAATDSSVAVGPTHIAGAVRQLGTIGAGGTQPDIVPVKKKALTIPVSEAASKASYRGVPAREAFPDAFLLDKAGTHGASPAFVGVIARKVGGRKNRKTGVKENQELEELYILVRRVAIRPHPYLPIDRAGNIVPAELGTEIDQLILANVFGGAN